MILIFILYMLFASTFTLGKLALAYTSPIFFIGLRMIVAGSLLLGYQYFFNKAKWKIELSVWPLYLKIITFHVFIAYIFEFWALQYVNASKACLLFNLSPFITAYFSYLVFSEKLSLKKWLGLCIGFAGMIPTLLAHTPLEDMIGGLWRISWPEIALLTSVASSAYGWMLVKQCMRLNYAPAMINGIGMFGGGLAAFITSLIIEGVPNIHPSSAPTFIDLAFAMHLGPSAPYIALLSYMGLLVLIANIICYNLYGYLLAKFSPVLLSFAGFTTPLFAAAYDWILVGQPVSWQFSIAIFATGIGLYIFYNDKI
jgi:drug/metabolite transporter (DMT)-like permease